ncbi:LysR family transcriptional regulator [Polymorphum gilvum]|uniref:Probable transcriptional regulator n=1 Tax=Polymorphum gilvum (strain LMG 25793 / CGMCC 1.9160 / SL003B-26A1) TaxID=991905 RepID=F2IVP3_POLGS|nr:LysR family transcriptional regulator [Polymorphum gilvum]ADZ69150.1 Probable transcriptional regulator [Polymorphum gilvum SL003B-26A1]
MTLTLKQVRYFIAAAETGQISHAAMEMNISQSAVTAAIQGLETQLGVRLLERRPTGVTMTAEGARFLNHARAIVAAVDDAVRSPLGEGARITGRVRLGVTYTVAGYFMARHYARFRRSYPGITLDMIELPRSAVEEALVDGQLDLSVMLTSNLSNHRVLDHETLFRSRRRLWLPSDHPLLSAPAITLADVAQEPYIMLTVDEASETAGRYWERAGLQPETVFVTSSVEAVRSMVAAGMGLTILSDMVYRPWSLEGQRIELRTLVDSIPSMDVGLAWARERPMQEAAAVFRAFISVALGSG